MIQGPWTWSYCLHSAEKFPGQRRSEKRELFKRFRVAPIHTLYTRRFFELFGNCCFNCGLFANPEIPYETRRTLCMDHHVPMALGGHLVPGNIVSLCRRCNELKLDRHPTEFYAPAKLQELQPLLERQHELFDFTFDWDQWQCNREGYMTALGIDAATIHDVLYDEEHPDFVGPASEPFVVTISLGDVLKRLS